MAERKGKRSERLADLVLRVLLGLLLALPYDLRVRLAGKLVGRVLGPLAGYRKRALSNLRMIYPDLDDNRCNAIADAALDNFGRTLIETYSTRQFSARMAGIQPRGEGLTALTEARAAGRPVLFVTGHFGNHEAPRHCLNALGFNIGGIYRAMGNPYFNDHYVKTLEDVSGPVFEQGRGTSGFVRHLKAGGLMTILFDVNDYRGQVIPFLGHPALTTTSPAELALRFDAVVIPYFGIRQDDGLTFDVVVEAPIPHGAPLEMMEAMTARLEAQIARHPGQWFWVHRRWKAS